MIGQVLGHYRVVSEIGRGGMGVVYRARDEYLHRDVAVKIVGKDSMEVKSSRARLLREARASSALSHPNICTLHEVGEFDSEPYIVMELVEGRPLSDLIGSEGLPVETVLRYGAQIAGALAHAHGRNIVHRDLKSSNVVVTPEGLVKVLDFGLARRLSEDAFSEATLTEESLEGVGAMSGTLSYMPPEVLRGTTADHRSDLWALGVVLYESVSGRLPFRGGTSFEVTSAILHEAVPPLPSRIPPSLWAIVQRCLAKEPLQRYQRAIEVQAALEAVQSASVTATARPSDQSGPFTSVQRGTRHLRVKNGDVLLLVGTTKGAFLLRSARERARWEVAGPYFHGQSIYAMAYDSRAGRHRLWASTHTFWGTYLRSSDDFGKVWTNPREANLKFPAEAGASLNNIWQICLGRPEDPDVLYCGTEPAALFESRDAGDTWTLVRGLWDHPHRPRWVPGNGGLTLHTLALDPTDRNRMYTGISAAGVYRSGDGGTTWEARNRGIRVVYAPEKYPEFGQCVHKFVMHPARPERLFLQNHWGLYRSDDGAESWHDIANGVPSDFGFAMLMHPHDPDCVYILPVESDEFRCTPEGRLRVFRTRNAGNSWEPLFRGLPQRGAYETVLRDAMTADALDPAGIYFGTRSGELYGSTDEGKNWNQILEGLPPVVCVKSALIGEQRSVCKPRPRPATRSAASRRRTSTTLGTKRERS
jgi:serine/threonine protein kinase